MKNYIIERWVCIQEQHNGNTWYFEPSIAYTRSQSIAKWKPYWDTTWRKARDTDKWQCIKVQIEIKPLNP